MSRDGKERHHSYRLPPCPSCDVEGMESWLTEMAEKGMILIKDGIWFGIAAFERGEPKALRYRLEAAPKGTSMWADNWGEPDPEAVMLNGEYGWEYVAKRGDFYIYRSSEPGVRELNTDPKVQAIALDEVGKRRKAAAFRLFFWLIIYTALQIRDNLLLTILQTGTWLFGLGTFLAFWLSGEALMEVIHLGKLRRKLLGEELLDHAKDWRKRAKYYYGRKCLRAVLILVWACCWLQKWNSDILEEDKILPADYHGELPFATMADFAGDGGYIYQVRNALADDFDYVKVWLDWLAPVNMEWVEHASFKCTDGTVIDGGLYVDYHEMANPVLARQLAREYYRHDMGQKAAVEMEIPEFAVDYVAGYHLYFPTVVIQEGNIVLYVRFYQTGTYESQVPMARWVECMINSIKTEP